MNNFSNVIWDALCKREQIKMLLSNLQLKSYMRTDKTAASNIAYKKNYQYKSVRFFTYLTKICDLWIISLCSYLVIHSSG